jgi:hypothetical protein
VRSVRCHHVDLVIAVAVGPEGNLHAVRRPLRGVVIGGVLGQVSGVSAERIDHEYIGVPLVEVPVAVEVGRECDQLAREIAGFRSSSHRVGCAGA